MEDRRRVIGRLHVSMSALQKSDISRDAREAPC
jgi:hypothetical protein